MSEASRNAAQTRNGPQPSSAAPASEANEPDLRLDAQLCFALYATSRLVTELYRPALSTIDLTYPQYLVMLVLWEKAPQSVGEICEKLYLDSGTVTPLLKRLERKGFLRRRRDADDERQVNVSLTPQGAALRATTLEVIRSLQGCMPFSDTRAVKLRDELRRALARKSSRG